MNNRHFDPKIPIEFEYRTSLELGTGDVYSEFNVAIGYELCPEPRIVSIESISSEEHIRDIPEWMISNELNDELEKEILDSLLKIKNYENT